MFRLGLVMINLLIAMTIFGQSEKIIGTTINYGTNELLDSEFKAYEVFQIDASSWSEYVQQRGGAAEVTLALDNGDHWSLQLFPNDLQADDYRLVVETPKGRQEFPKSTVKTFAGHVLNPGGGELRLTLDRDFIYGYFEKEGALYFIEPLYRLVPEAPRDYYLFYRASDVNPTTNLKCGWTDMKGHHEQTEHKGEDAEPNEKLIGQCYIAEVALAADFSIFQLFGGAAGAENFMLGTLNNVQTNYDDEFADEVQFQVVTVFVASCLGCNPWTSSNDGELLLESFRDWGNSGGFGPGIAYDFASLWSDRNFTGPPVGLAWLGGLCGFLRYNVLQHFTSSAVLLRVVQSHEIGHNFNANHDSQGQPFIMAPSVNATNDWSSNSINRINNYINTSGCLSPCTALGPPIAGIFAPVTHVCPGSVVPFIDNSSNLPNSWQWQFIGNSPSSSNQQSPTVVFQNPGTYPVVLTVSNSSGLDVATLNSDVQVDENGTKYLLYATFEEGPAPFTVQNPDNDITWEVATVGTANYGRKAMRMDNFNYDASGQKDALISPVLNLAAEADVILEIDYAYARYSSSLHDKLTVSVSTNGGVSFPTILFTGQENGNGSFATAPETQSAFVPAVFSDWCYGGGFGAECITLSLNQFIGHENVVIKIENENGYGNNMYIDNVRISSSCVPPIPPMAAFSADVNQGCAPLTVSFFDESDGLVSQYQWNFPGAVPAFSDLPNPTVTYPNPGVYEVSLAVTNSVGTNVVTEPAYITISGPPIANFAATNTGNEVFFDNLSENATAYNWDFGDGNSSTDFSPSHTYAVEGTYSVTLVATNECGTTNITEEITIESPLTADIEATSTEGCPGLVVEFTDLSEGDITSWNWTFPGGTPATSTEQNPVVTYSTPGLFDVTLVLSNGLSETTLDLPEYISVGSLPNADFNINNQLGSLDIDLVNNSSNSLSYAWDFGDGHTSSAVAPSYTYEEDGTYEVQLIVTNACGQDTFAQTVTILTPPVAEITTQATDGCMPLVVDFAAAPVGPGLTYSWVFPGGTPATSEAANPSITYSTFGSYDVALTVTNDAGSDTVLLTDHISVGALPVAAFDLNNVLGAMSIDLTNNSSAADSYSWNFGDGNTSVAANPTHIYEEEGTYTVELIVANTCGTDTFTQVVTILAPPLAEISADVTSGCAPLTVQYMASPTGDDLTYAWTFFGGSPATSTDANPTVVYSDPDLYDVQLIVTNMAGSDTIEITEFIEVFGLPTAGFDLDNAVASTVVTTTNNSIDADTYEWDFGDGETSMEAAPTHDFGGAGTYTVQLVASNECGRDTSTQEINIYTLPEANITFEQTSNCAPVTVQFMASPSGPELNYIWSFPGGTPSSSTLANPEVTYNAPGLYDVSLIVRNPAGSDTLMLTELIEVQPLPTAAFTADNSLGTTEVAFFNASNDAVNYEWNFGDGTGSMEENPVHDYEGDGTYVVRLIASNECGSDTSELEITILTPPTVGLTVDTDLGCVPFTANFAASPVGEGLTYVWTFPGGNPATSNLANPEITYNTVGQFDVQLIVANAAGADTISFDNYITTGTVPDAAFNSQVNGFNVQFFNVSEGADSYVWDFGDDSTSTAENPIHEYSENGTYTVTLTATNECGSTSVTGTVTIDSTLPVVNFEATGNTGCAPLTVSFQSLSENADSLIWTFPGGMPEISNLVNPVVVYNTPGIYNVSLVAFNPAGSAGLTEVELVIVDGLPTADYSFTTNELTVTFTNNSTHADTYQWDFGAGVESTDPDPVYTFAEAGTYQVQLIATNACGNDTITQEVIISGMAPFPAFSADTTVGCLPLTVQFTDESMDGTPTEWLWTFPGGDPATSTEQNPTVVYNAPGSYEVSLQASNAFGGATVSLEDFITIIGDPIAAFDFTLSSGPVITFNALGSENAANYIWDFGDGTEGEGAEIAHEYTLSGDYEVSLVVSNECGTDTLTQTVMIIIDGLDDLGHNTDMQVFPNPNTGQFTLWIQGAGLPELEVRMWNVRGQHLYQETLNFNGGELRKQYDFSALAAGIYYIQIGSNNRFITQKLIIE